MERLRPKKRQIMLALTLVVLAVLMIVFWRVFATLLAQLFWAYLLMGAALPLCRLLERKLSPSASATVAFLLLTLFGAGLLLILVPALVRQFQQLATALPNLIASVRAMLEQLQAWLAERGVAIAPVEEELFGQLKQLAGQVLPKAAEKLQSAASGLSTIMLAPLLAFYLLRDRRKICAWLTLLVPVRHRKKVVCAAREMRRETAGFLRGQLLISAVVGLLTGIGMLLVGTPGWLLLGVLMGVMELIPYLGPLLAGIPAVLLALQGGFVKALWALAVLVGVQQLEGGFLSPRMLAGATNLSPLAVLLSISAGGLLGGTLGMLLALPVVVSIRGAVRALRG